MSDQNSEYSYRSLKGRDEVAVKELVRNAFGSFLEGNYWDWKYKRNPDFDPSLVAVAEKDGEIVGCNHWLVRDVKFSEKLVVKTVLGADVTVDSEHRRRGIGRSLLLFLRFSEAFRKRNVVISYTFPNPQMINPLYRPSLFYVPAPSKTTCFIKILNWETLKKKLDKINRELESAGELQEKLSDLDMKVIFHIKEAPILPLKISGKGIEIDEKDQDKGDIVFSIDLATFESLKGAEHKTLKLFKAWFMRKLKIKGSLSNIVKLYRNFWIFQEIFG